MRDVALYSIDQLPLADLQQRGLRLLPRQIYDPTGPALEDAVVQSAVRPGRLCRRQDWC